MTYSRMPLIYQNFNKHTSLLVLALTFSALCRLKNVTISESNFVKRNQKKA